MSKTVQTIYQLKRGTTAEWEANKDYVPAEGEPCLDLDKGTVKYGDGVTTYENLKESGSQASHYEGVKQGTESNTDVITRTLTELGVTAQKDDIFIVKALIADDKYAKTALVYNGTDWVAMDGNYDAENVYFQEDMTFTYEFGKYAPDSTGSVTVPAEGKNIKELFLGAYAEEKDPTITDPSITSLSASPNVTKEVGTTYDLPSATLKVSTGSYSYGSVGADGTKYTGTDTGIVFSSMKITNDKTADEFTSSNSNADLTGTIAEANLTDRTVTDADIKYTFSATATFPDSDRYPVTNLGNEYLDENEEKQNITGDTLTKTATATIKGYRAFFYGPLATATADEALTSDIVRDLTNGGNYNGSKTITIKSADVGGAKRFVVAIPTANTRAGITKVMKTDGLATEVTTQWIKQETTLDVEGANGYEAVAYDIWLYEPAKLDAAEVHEITLG